MAAKAQEETDELLTSTEAALLLKVSRGYLRNADCPKLLLPPQRGTRKLVRYRRSALLAWAASFDPKAQHEDAA